MPGLYSSRTRTPIELPPTASPETCPPISPSRKQSSATRSQLASQKRAQAALDKLRLSTSGRCFLQMIDQGMPVWICVDTCSPDGDPQGSARSECDRHKFCPL